MKLNEEVLLYSFSRQLHVEIRVYDQKLQWKKTVCRIHDFQNPYYEYIDISYYLKLCREKQIPICFSVEEMYYTITGNPEGYYVLGPFRMKEATDLYWKETLPESAPKREGDAYKQWFLKLSLLEFQKWLEAVLLLHNIFREDPIREEDILWTNLAQQEINEKLRAEFSQLLFKNVEEAIHHNPYDQEVREQTSIENGDLDALRTSMAEDYTGTMGTLSKDSLRNSKNLGIVLTTLSSRSAIRGGLSPEIAFSLSDAYIQNMEEINNISNLDAFMRSMEYHYCSLVHEIRTRKKSSAQTEEKETDVYQEEKPNPMIEQCKNYIYAHLHDRITVKELAEKLGYHPDYLSHMFKQYEKVGISEYITRERIDRSKNLLIYSDYTYSQIANYLGFASQSHFGKQFKRYTGYTPKQFRQIYAYR